MSFKDELAEQQLADLQWHWSGAYQIERTGPETWLAARLDGLGAVHAASAEELFEAIRRDYASRAVPRNGEVGS